MLKIEKCLIEYGVLRKFVKNALEGKDVRTDVAEHVTESLVQTSLRGVDSHGVRLLPHYLRAIDSGRINPQPSYSFSKTTSSTGKLDADHTFGHAAGGDGMLKACSLAKENGVGCVSVYNSTHFGAAAYFSLLAAKQDLIGISFTHADSLMKSYQGKRAFFGTNPICFAAPCEGEDPFCLDIATTRVNWNKILQYRENSRELPSGWAFDSDGIETLDPNKASFLASIGEYKGFGLAMMIEVLCSLLTGMPFGRDLTKMYADPIEKKRMLGHFFMAIKIDAFEELDVFKTRMKDLMNQVRDEPSLNHSMKVLVPGDPEKESFKLRMEKGIPLDEVTSNSFKQIATELGIEFKVR